MFLGYRMKKRSMAAYDKVMVPEIRGYQPVSEEKPVPAARTRHPFRSVLRAAACMVLAFLLIGLIVSRNNQGLGTFTLMAYAAAPTGNTAAENSYALSTRSYNQLSGVTLQKNTKTPLPTGKIYITKGTDGNNYGSNIESFYDNIAGTKFVALSSGFQFSGDTIDSVTMTSEKGRFIAYDLSKTLPIDEKYVKVKKVTKDGMVFAVNDGQYSDADQQLMDSLIKRGTTVTFSPAGMTAYWDYTLDAAKKTADTLTITVKYLNGKTQTSVVSISEGDDGTIVAELR